LPDEFGWHRDMTREGLAAADTVVAPSAGYAGLVKQSYGLPALPLVVHNGRRPLAEPVATAGKMYAALTVGRLWDEVKNARFLDQVAQRLDVPFLAAGPLRGPHGEEFSLRHLRALGRLESGELATLLALRPVFVSAATFEPFGLAVLEAAAAGCPLVLSDIATFRELWDGAALFVDPADTAGFAGAIQSLIADEDLAAAMGKAAATRAGRYTPAATARRMEQIYARALAPAEVAA
jgi:glycosyltransferase involved in cell wall biosynthesis